MERKKAERTRGIYYLFKNGEIVYVGQSVFCEKRIIAHFYNKDFDEYEIKKVEKKCLDKVEIKAIIKYQPKYNKTFPKNKKFIPLKAFLKEKNGKKAYGVKKRLAKIYSEGIKPINLNGMLYYEKEELERININ